MAYDREHVVVLSDWTFRDPKRAIAKMKKEAGYFNYQQRTLGDFVSDVNKMGWSAAVQDRMMWAQMRMDPTDILDVTGSTYTYLVNGLPPDGNWTGLVRAGERVRLRFINASSMTYFNVRIPGLPLTIVQADGQNVQPVTVDEFQIAVAETYDVIVSRRPSRPGVRRMRWTAAAMRGEHWRLARRTDSNGACAAAQAATAQRWSNGHGDMEAMDKARAPARKAHGDGSEAAPRSRWPGWTRVAARWQRCPAWT